MIARDRHRASQCGICSKHAGTRWRSWSRHRITNRKAAGSIPDRVIEILHWLNPSGRTQPLTEMSTRDFPRRLRRPVLRADNVATFVPCRANSHIPCRAPAVLCRGLGKVLCKAARSKHSRGTAWYVWIKHDGTVLFKWERENLNH